KTNSSLTDRKLLSQNYTLKKRQEKPEKRTSGVTNQIAEEKMKTNCKLCKHFMVGTTTNSREFTVHAQMQLTNASAPNILPIYH
ncbi:hypothetical protein M5D96_006001, partial [Drosophila gunungcola]